MIPFSLLHKKDLRLLLLIQCILLLMVVSVYPQTVIREKVKINPSLKKISNVTTEYSPLIFYFGGPRPCSFTITGAGGNFSGSNAGFGEPITEIPVQAVNGDYHVVVTSYCECTTNVEYGVIWNNPQGQNEVIAGYEMWFSYPGIMIQKDNFSFNGIPPPPDPFDFSILLTPHIVYGTQESLIKFTYGGDNPSGDKSVSLHFEPADSSFVFFDQDLWQNVENTLTTTLDDSYKYSVKYESNNSNYPKHVKVIAVSHGLQREDTLFVEQPNYVTAYFEKDNLSPGDTVNIIIQEVDTQYGWESNYPDTTHFEVGIKEGCDAGDILTPDGSKRKYFHRVMQPIKFVVADSLSADIDSVVLRVGAPIIDDSGGGIISGSIVNKTNSKMSVTSRLSKTQSKQRMKKVLDGEYCASGNYTYGNVDYPKAKPIQLEIIYPKKDSQNENIDKTPKMPDVICKARLKGYNGGAVKYEWEYWVCNTLKRDGNKCARVTKIEFTGDATGNNSEISSWKVSFTKDHIKSISIKSISQKHCSEEISEWNYGNDVFIGGQVWVKVTAKNSKGEIIDTQSVNANQIIGLNPDKTEVIQYISNSNEIMALIETESYPDHGHQFAFSPEFESKEINAKIKKGLWVNGYPLYGKPNGWGMMQIDNYGTKEIPKYASDLDLWNWKNNVDSGCNLFKDKKTKAKNYLTNLLVDPPSDDDIRMESWQLYNGGHYYGPVLNPDDGEYYLGKTTKLNHADKALQYYNELIGL